MQRFAPDSASFGAALQAIWVDLEPHIREEATADLDRLEQALSPSASEALGQKYGDIRDLLQKPYGADGVPDAQTIAALLEMPRQELLVRIGEPLSA